MTEKVYQAIEDGELKEVALPEYVCHKIVRAALIVAIAFKGDNLYRLALEHSAHVDVSKLWVTTKNPQAGGYFVQYEDGYSSYSPAQAFEEGYTPVTDHLTAVAPPIQSAELDTPIEVGMLSSHVGDGAAGGQFATGTGPAVTVGDLLNILDAAQKRVEQLNVQMAGITAAALGWGGLEAKPGDYGFSVPYQDVLNLRHDYEKMKEALAGQPRVVAQFPESGQIIAPAVDKVEAGIATSVPSAADLDAVAEEQRAAASTAAREPADPPIEGNEAASMPDTGGARNEDGAPVDDGNESH